MARLFDDNQARFFRDHLHGTGNSELASLMNNRFRMNLTRQQVKSYKKNHNLTSGLTGRFKKGHVPANKGKHQVISGNMVKTMFKPGQSPHNIDPIGTEKVKTDGYVWVKVKNEGPMHKRWKQKHRIIWEQANGPILKGNRIMFADGNKRNFNLDNLVMVTPAEMARLSRGGYVYPNSEMTKTMLNVVKVRNRVSSIEDD